MKNLLAQLKTEDWVIVLAGVAILALALLFPAGMPAMPKTLAGGDAWLEAGCMFAFLFVLTCLCMAVLGRPVKGIFGSLLAMLFTGIWPQRAFIHWRIQMASYVTNFNRLYQAGFSPNLVDRPRLEKHLQQALNDVVKMRGLITPASKETHIQKAIFEAIQTVSRNLVCMLELQINAWWATRPGHFVMLNAHTLRETQQMTQQTLLSIAHALYEGNPQPVRANNEKLTEIVLELRQLLKEQGDDGLAETPVHGYVWLSIELARQLELLSHLICRALRK